MAGHDNIEENRPAPTLTETADLKKGAARHSPTVKIAFFSLVFCLVGTIIWGSIMTNQYIQSKNKLSSNTNVPTVDREEPVVIIGGGAAGTYLAWRLASASDSEYSPVDIHLYERTDHISGRLFSPTVGKDLCMASDEEPDSSHLPRTELGGMRVRTKDKILLGLMEELGIEIGPFYMNANNETSDELVTNPMFARNILGTQDDFTNKDNKIPFSLGYQELPLGENYTHYTPNFEKSNRPAINASGYDPCDGTTNKDVFFEPYGPQGQPFYTYSLRENARVFAGETGEDVKFVEAVSGYAIESADIGVGSPDFAGVVPSSGAYSYVRPLNGMQTIPQSLNDAAVKLGVSSNLNQEITKIEELEGGDWLVTIRETMTSKCTSITKMKNNGSIMKVIRTKRVILALPAAALKRIEFVTTSSNGSLHRLINKIASESTPLPLMKLFAAWPTRWWNKVNHLDTFSSTENPTLVPGRSTNFTCGRFTNDINSHLYSWYPGTQSRPETIKENASACKDMGVIQLYVFPDRLSKFVSAAQIEDQIDCADDDNCDVCKPEESDSVWFKPAISTRLQNLLSVDLSTLFRIDVPDASEIMYRIWSGDDPVTRSDGVHFWRAGIKWWESYKDALQPQGKGGTIHLIGEVFSHNQGWAEGAVETAEHLLQEVIQLPPPSWLKNEDYCKSMPFYVDRVSDPKKDV